VIFDRRRYGTDNYTYLVAEGGDAALVDPGDAVVALGMAAAHGVRPRWILHTHGHADHTGGSEVIRQRVGARVLGHSGDAARFAPDEDLAGRAEVALGAITIRVHEAPGHTPGSIVLEIDGKLLTGDTLFWGGAGNCRNGGDPARLARTFATVFPRLDPALLVHPGHDYAEPNLSFVIALEPGNVEARARLEAARAARRGGGEPLASTLAEERAVNPFLRAGDPGVRDAVARRTGARLDGSPDAVFVALRALRDRG
jgi:hydroxyacylglutathione hydrolase